MRSYPKSPQRSKTTPQQAEARGFDTMRMLEILARPRIAAALESDGADVRLVGRWIWTEFESRPSNRTRSFLRAIGFKWNSKRKLWQHCCGVRSVRSVRSVHSPSDPRGRYGSVPVSALADDEGRKAVTV